MNLTVRYAKQEELPRVNVLRQQVSELHAQGRPDVFRPGFCEELRQRINDFFAAPEYDVIVACLDGTVCGFAVVQYVERPESAYQCARRFYHIEEFGVDPAFRRRGVGTALLDFCRGEARRGVGALRGWSWMSGASMRRHSSFTRQLDSARTAAFWNRTSDRGLRRDF